jgi:hypothetical protein
MTKPLIGVAEALGFQLTPATSAPGQNSALFPQMTEFIPKYGASRGYFRSDEELSLSGKLLSWP